LLKINTLYWFTHDLRLQDNLLLNNVCDFSDEMSFVYVLNESDFKANNFQQHAMGKQRLLFTLQAISNLALQLAARGHNLILLKGNPVSAISKLCEKLQINTLAVAHQVGVYERQWLKDIEQNTSVRLHSAWQHTLWHDTEVLSHPAYLNSFSKYRRFVEKQKTSEIAEPLTLKELFPPATKTALDFMSTEQVIGDILQSEGLNDESGTESLFQGGEYAASAHLKSYFDSTAPSTYKETRNELDGWQLSTKFSPYLAQGSLSPRQVWHAVEQYESNVTKNESTYWIKFELLWREYFQWLALYQGESLFSFKGQANSKPLTSFFPERFKKWCEGETPYPLVNACMKQLNHTGFMSNRGRQIVASCLVNELCLDWRYGAAYFQQQLLDYDVASNWGNWQYIAGVGVDPRGGRHFNIEKQHAQYDPHDVFVNHWLGKQDFQPLDSVDAADWPVDTRAQ